MAKSRDLVFAMAPPPPPCFHSRLIWLEYLTSAAEGQASAGESKVLVLRNGKHEFNRDFDYCRDCEVGHAALAKQRGKCNPNALRESAEESA